MSYIGNKPSQTLASPTSQYFNGTGSQTVFTLNRLVNVSEDLEVFVNNIQQEPGVGKSYTATGSTLTFDAAPSAGTSNVYVVYRGLAEVTTRLETDPNSAISATTGTFSGDLTVDTNTLYVDSANNRIGIGTTSPSGLAEFYKAGTSEVLIGSNNAGTAQLSFYEGTSSTKEGFLKYDGASNNVVLGTSGAANAVVVARDTGNVGIGATETTLFNVAGGTAKLVVTGNTTNTNIAANTDASIVISNTATTAGNTSGLHFARADTDDSPNYAGASIVSQFPDEQATGQYPRGELAFLTSTSANTAPSEKMRISAAGNVGIGTVPETFNTVDGAMQVGTRQTLTSFSNDAGIGYNHYYNSGWKRTNTDVARRFSSTSTIPFIWQYAASGSAGSAITWSEAMRITSSGNATFSGSVTATGGFVGAGNTPAFCVTRNSDQTSNSGIATLVQWNAEIYDSDGKFASNRFTPTVAGYYYLFAQVNNNNLYNQAALNIWIRKNGSNIMRGAVAGNNSTSNRDYTINCSIINVADSDDYFEVYAEQQLGNGQMIASADRCVFLGYKVG